MVTPDTETDHGKQASYTPNVPQLTKSPAQPIGIEQNPLVESENDATDPSEF